MLIECTRPRVGGTSVDFPTATYNFMLDKVGRYVATVTDAAHIAKLLSSPETYREVQPIGAAGTAALSDLSGRVSFAQLPAGGDSSKVLYGDRWATPPAGGGASQFSDLSGSASLAQMPGGGDKSKWLRGDKAWALRSPDPTIFKPFSSNSQWRRALDAGASFASTPAFAAGTAVSVDSWDATNNWSFPCYEATESDQLVQVLYNPNAYAKVYSGEWVRSGNNSTIEAAILGSSSSTFPSSGNPMSSVSTSAWTLPPSYNKTPLSAPTFRVPAGALPAPGWDGHIHIAQPDRSVLECYAAIRLSTGQIVCTTYAVTYLDSVGDGWQNGKTASMIPGYAGLLHDEEVAAGAIDHAMAIAIPPASLTASITYPAFAFDRDAATASTPYGGSIPMGARLAIPPSVDLSTLGLQSDAGRAIARAAQTYGFIVVDRGGSGVTIRCNPTPKTPSAAMRTYDGYLANDLSLIVTALKRVTPSASATIKSSPSPKFNAADPVASGLTLAFESTFSSLSKIDISRTKAAGFDWYVTRPFDAGYTSAAEIAIDADGLILTPTSDTANFNLASAALNAAGNGLVGRTFGGGGYFEATIKCDPTAINTADGWPSWWSFGAEHALHNVNNADQWKGQPNGQIRYAEVDFFEALVSWAPRVAYGATVHDMAGPSGSFNSYINDDAHGWNSTADPDPSILEGGYINWTKWHKFGCLWIPAGPTNGFRGSLTWYMDDLPTNVRVYWSAPKYGSFLPDATELAKTGANTSPYLFSILDQQKLMLILGAGKNQTMRVKSVRVWSL